MSRAINPMIDSAFKALFATDANRHLLTSLLNAVVQPEVPIVSLEYLDPADEPDRHRGRRTVVDVKVRDGAGHLYQVEVQVVLHEALAERMTLAWARLFDRQFQRGQAYSTLLPVTSVWILDRRFRSDGEVHRHYALRDHRGELLTRHCNLHILDLANLSVAQPGGVLEDWLYFLKNARDWTELPPALNRGVLQEAMQVMKRFSQDDIQYFRYIAELDAETVEITRRESMSQALDKLTHAESALQEQVELVAGKDELLADQQELLADKDELLADSAAQLAQKDIELARLAELVRRLTEERS